MAHRYTVTEINYARSMAAQSVTRRPTDLTNAQIHNLLYEALELIDAPLDLLQIVGSWKDTQSASATLEQLQAFIEREKARESS